MRKLKKKTILLYLLITVILLVIVGVLPKVSNVLTPTEVANHGTLEVTEETEACIVRDATVYKAEMSGKVTYKAEEGDLVRKNDRLMRVEEDNSSNGTKEHMSSSDKKVVDSLGDALEPTETFRAGRKGIFSTYADGEEAFFSPSKMASISESEAQKHKESYESLKKDVVNKGEPVYCISDNTVWYLLCWVKEGSIGKYEKGSNVRVKMLDTEVPANITEIKSDGSKYCLTLKASGYCKGLEKERFLKVELVNFDNTGLIISNDDICTRKGKVGVYVKTTTGDYVFTPIQVLGTDGEQSVISENAFYDKKGNSVNTVRIYDEVLKHPKKE